jgi:23S rRNA pseudouridine2457 synthase
MNQYFILNKPTNMLSQFISSYEIPTLQNLDYTFPTDIHALGRLDRNSEGVLLLTNNKKMTQMILNKNRFHIRTYLVMVKNKMTDESIEQLQKGVTILQKEGKGYYTTLPCKIERVTNAEEFYPYSNDHREQYPHTWLLMQLTEGKFRQIRKMVRMVKHPCMRLIRISVENLHIAGMKPGEVKSIPEEQFLEALNL